MKHKMWSRLLSMVLAMMMVTSIVPTSAFAEAASEIAASSQATSEVQVEEVPLTEDTTTEEPAAETPAEEPAGEPASEPTAGPAPESVPTEEPVAEPTETPATETEQPTAEPTQAPAETAVPSEQPSAEPTAAPEGTETPEATAVPSATPAPSESPLPSASPVPSATPVPSETPVVLNAEEYTENAQTADGIVVEVIVPAESLPEGAELKVERREEGGDAYENAAATLEQNGVEFDSLVVLNVRFECDGQEVEPAHPVQVKIAASDLLPQDVNPATVAVQHLKENEDGTVTVESVAAAEEGAAEVQAEAPAPEQTGTVTTDGSQLVAEFTVSSFSDITITGIAARASTEIKLIGKNKQFLKIRYGAEDTSDISVESPVASMSGIEEGTEFDLNDLCREPCSEPEGSKYRYLGAYIDFQADGYKYPVEKIKYMNEDGTDATWYYKGPGDTDWEIMPYRGDKLDKGTIWFVYRRLVEVDGDRITSDDGIRINLYDYGTDINAEIQAKGANFYFKDDHYPGGKFPIPGDVDDLSRWTGSAIARQGIVKNTLANDGYPVFVNMANKEYQMGKFLFLDKYLTHKNLTGLFEKDEDGYYSYDSSQNFATVQQTDKTDGGQFVVYEKPFGESTNKRQPHFMPYNDIYYNAKQNKVAMVEDKPKDFHFAMTMDFTFLQPAGGKINNESMIFEFNGDDDVWVFIDDVLVLDLGGIHDAVGGRINFATGDVIVEKALVRKEAPSQAVENKTTTLRALFEEALGEKNPLIDEYFAKGSNTFKDYTSHRFKYYYIERGAYASNCEIKFNLPTLPSSDLAVAKTVTQLGTNSAVDNKTGFTFQLTKNGKGQPKETYQVYRLDDYTANPQDPGKPLLENQETGQDGCFTLQHNQVAVFNDILKDANGADYSVTEILGENLISEISSVYVNGQPSKNNTASFANSNYALFNNRVRDKSAYSLTLTKKWKNKNGADLAANAEIPFTKLQVTVEQVYKTDDGTDVEVLNSDTLVQLTKENSWRDTYDYPVQNYTSFQVVKEEVYIGNTLIVTYTYDDQNGSWTTKWEEEKYKTTYAKEWSIGEFEFSRNYQGLKAMAEQVEEPTQDKRVFTFSTNGYFVAKNGTNALIWTPWLEDLSDDVRNDYVKAAIQAALKGRDEFQGVTNWYFYDDENLPADLGQVKEKITAAYSGDTVTITLSDTNVCEKVAYGPFEFTHPELTASLSNTLDTTEPKTQVSVKKQWMNTDGTAPSDIAFITVNLKQNGKQYASEKLNQGNDWSYTFEELPKYNADGTLVKYTVEEVPVPGYKVEYEGNAQSGFVIKNTPNEGYLKITKTLQNTDGNEFPGFGGGKDVFSFKITDKDGKTWYMHVNGNGDATTATVDGTQDTLTLNAGQYTVTELDNINYEFESVTDDNGGTVEPDKKSIQVTISGDKTTTVSFVNKRKEDPGITDGSGVINKFTQDKDGTITITGVPVKKPGGSDDTEVTGNPNTSGN